MSFEIVHAQFHTHRKKNGTGRNVTNLRLINPNLFLVLVPGNFFLKNIEKKLKNTYFYI
jgi:hypothetical protein